MILFLDFDGVLHLGSVYLEKGRPVLRGDGELFMWASLLIEALEPHPHIKIVLSTNWVRSRGFTQAKAFLPKALQKRAIGSTWHSAMNICEYSGARLPYCWYDEATRFQQITRYVDRSGVDQWLAIDDLHEGVEAWSEAHQHRFILTDPNKGLSDPAALERLKALLQGLSV